MQADQIVLIVLGALAGGFINGLTGFGTAMSAMGIWLYAISPPVAASLAVICSVVAQVQTLPMIWGTIEWRRVLPFVLPGLVGVPIGTWLLPQIDPRTFRLGVGIVLVAYSGYVLSRKVPMRSTIGGRAGDGLAGFSGGVLGGLAGFSGVPPIVWTDIRGWSKEQRRTVLQVFNVSILGAALLSHALSGLLTREVGWATLAALPGTVGGAFAGALAYKRLGDRGYQRIVMALLLVSGLVLLGASW
jgi:uncharacterized protein